MTKRPRFALALRILIFFCGLTIAVAQADPAEGVASGPALGLSVDDVGQIDAAALVGVEASGSVRVRLTARWSDVEPDAGFYDWSEHERAVSALNAAGYRVVLCLTGSNPLHTAEGGPPSPLDGDSLNAWLGFVRSASRTFAGSVEAIQIWDRVGPVETAFDPETYAFVLKTSALAVRAEAKAASRKLAVAQAVLAEYGLEWQRRLWEADVAAYVDILPAEFATDAVGTGELTELQSENLRHPPAARIWADIVGGTGVWEAPGAAVTALAAGAEAAFVDLPRGPASEAWPWLVGAQRTLDGEFAPAPIGTLSFEGATGVADERAQVFGRFFSGTDFSTLIFYHAPGDSGGAARGRLIVDTGFVRNAMVLDPMTGRALRMSAAPLPDGAKGRAIRIISEPHPLILKFDKAAAAQGLELPPEQIRTEGSRELTAAEIIARYQQVQKIEDDLLERWVARGRVDFHFKLAQGGATVDVSIESNYFWERGGDLEWEQTDYYINGNKLGWKKIPELPLIQAEKVVTLPLDLTLDKTYSYRSVGRGRVGERDAYVLEFQPVDPDAPSSLYRGKIWIDVETFARLKASVVQTQLEAPVLSNEETDIYEDIVGPGGDVFRMLTEIDGQQIWTAAGQSFVVRREVSFDRFEINPPRSVFEERRAEAYASTNQMLRDTDDGFRYLERQDDGTRTVKETMDTSQLFAGGGAFKDASTDGVQPLGGVNYFDYDLWGKGIQVNAFFAGVIGFFTASDPDLFDRKIDATANATLVGIKFNNKLFDLSDGEERLPERLETRDQFFSVQLGFPAGQFVKFNVVGGWSYREFFDEKDAQAQIAAINDANQTAGDPERLEFVLPRDHQQLTGTLRVEFNRRGYTLAGSASFARRSEWETWGLRDTDSGSFGRSERSTSGTAAYAFVPGTPEPAERSFRKWGASAFKEWYLPKFQKIRGEINYLDGSNLDRFSRYRFTLFGDTRLSGFSGTGVLFDEGIVARTGYSFNLFDVIRLDGLLESAQVKRFDTLEGSQSFTGVGLAANFVGPWKTVINFNYGYALSSDIPVLEGEQEFLLVVLKLF